jgi:rod shape-determining protein MreD
VGAILSFPVMAILVMLQMVVVSRLPLLGGTADLVLLVLIAWALQERVKMTWLWAIIGGVLVGYVSALPWVAPLISYLLITALIRYFQKKVWQSPIMAMFVCTTIGSIFSQLISIAAIRFSGTHLPIAESLSLVVLPSTILNLILALPVYAVVADMASWLYPQEVEV